ncbi:MAG TPA: gamma subclass chorismate mutase AroQ [Burkholderiaceae bacterium]|jgi:chorismate mutase
MTNQRRFGRLLWLALMLQLLALTLLQSCAHAPPSAGDRPEIARLMQLIDQRLAIAPMVAEAKWNSGAPIDDPTREKLLLDTLGRQAQAAGLDRTFAQRFFQAQFDAGKLIQTALHARWRIENRPPFDAAPDLARDVRPLLDQMTPNLIAALRDVAPLLNDQGTKSDLEIQGKQWIRGDYDGAPRTAALQVLMERAAK